MFLFHKAFFSVGMRRFELPTSSTPCWRDTWLRYIPRLLLITFFPVDLPNFDRDAIPGCATSRFNYFGLQIYKIGSKKYSAVLIY